MARFVALALVAAVSCVSAQIDINGFTELSADVLLPFMDLEDHFGAEDKFMPVRCERVHYSGVPSPLLTSAPTVLPVRR